MPKNETAIRILFPLGGALIGLWAAYMLDYHGAASGVVISIFAGAAYAWGLRLHGSGL